MPQPYDYFGLMGGAANIGGVAPSIQNTLLGQQNIQQNDNVLATQARAEQARQALAIATDPNAAPELRDQAMGQLQQHDPAQAQALRAQMQQKQALGAYFQNPTAKGTMELIASFPALKDEISKGWDVYSGAAKEAKLAATADAYGYLQAGDAAGAIKIVRDHMEADKAAGLDTNGYQDLIDAITANPTSGKAIAGLMLAAGAGPEKFAEAHGKIGERERADELQPSAVLKGVAEASKAQTEAQYAPQKAESDLATAGAQRQKWSADIANDVARLALDRDKLTLDRDQLDSTVQLELEKLDRNGTQLDAGGRQAVNAAVGQSVSASALADRANSLAERFAGADVGGWGWASAARESLKGAYGGQDPVTGLRNEYEQIVNQQAVKNLPPGPASDKDIQLAKQGFPPRTASKEYIVSFLRGMAKMQQAVAASSDRQANWIATNGSLAPARRDVDVGGVRVPAGTTFNEFNGNATKRGRQGETPAGLQSIYAKYGGGH